MGKLGKEKTKESSRQEALIAMQEAAMGMSQADEEVMKAFVKRILLEEGAPRIIRCDNGTEFKNKTDDE